MKPAGTEKEKTRGEHSVASKEQRENENIEIKLLIESIYLKYGYDFRNYAEASLKRRIRKSFAASRLKNISQMQHKLLHDTRFFEKILLDLRHLTKDRFSG